MSDQSEGLIGGSCSVTTSSENIDDDLFTQAVKPISPSSWFPQLDSPFTLYNDMSLMTSADDCDPDLNYYGQLITHPTRYLCSDQLDEFIGCNSLNENLKLLHLNIRSFNKNGAALLEFLETCKTKFDIIALTETWSTPATEDQIYCPGYNVICRSRPQGIGGGIAILIKDTLRFELENNLPDSNTDLMESVF